MEWVETTGRSIEEALDAALDELGVDVDEVEYEVLAEPRGGFLGRLGGSEARIRARVKPVSREKPGDKRRRGRRSGGRSDSQGESVKTGARAAPPSRRGTGGSGGSGGGNGSDQSRRRRRSGRPPRAGGDSSGDGGAGNGQRAATTGERSVEVDNVTVEQQAEAAESFTRGLIEAWGVEATLEVRVEDEENVLVDVTGTDLGLLVGPKGATLRAIEELVRTVVQRRTEGHGVRIHVDVAGYQAKRRTALEEFVRDLAGKVIESGRDQALEPMTASDRKVVHDTVAEIDGVSTISEGEDPRRRVVIRRDQT